MFIDGKKVRPSKIEEKVGETLKLTRERSSGQNIHDEAKVTFTKQKDGTLMKKVTKQTYANVTVREKCGVPRENKVPIALMGAVLV